MCDTPGWSGGWIPLVSVREEDDPCIVEPLSPLSVREVEEEVLPAPSNIFSSSASVCSTYTREDPPNLWLFVGEGVGRGWKGLSDTPRGRGLMGGTYAYV
jgi:hypothetical protein